MRQREPKNRAERRALDRAVKRQLKKVKRLGDPDVAVGGKIGVRNRYAILDKDGRDVTAERIRRTDP